MDKQGKAVSTKIVYVGVFLLAALVILGAYALFKPVEQSTVGGTGNALGGGGGGVNVYTAAETLNYIGTDKLQPGTGVLVSVFKRAKGDARFAAAANPDSVSQGQTYDLLFTNATYHSVYVPGYVAPQGTTASLEQQLLGNASVTIRVFNTDTQRMTDGGGVNQSVATGGSYNLNVFMDGQDLKGTGDMMCILEGSDSNKIQKLTLSGGGATFVGQQKPASYSLLGTSSGLWVYDVSAVDGATSTQFTLGVQSKSGQSISGEQFKIDCLTKEHFIDPVTGNVAQGVEDSNGVRKSLAEYSFTGSFT